MNLICLFVVFHICFYISFIIFVGRCTRYTDGAKLSELFLVCLNGKVVLDTVRVACSAPTDIVLMCFYFYIIYIYVD